MFNKTQPSRGVRWRAGAILTVLLCGALPSAGDESQRLELHGFGEWLYGRTNQNQFLSGSPEGEYDNSLAGMTLNVTLTDDLRTVTQAVVSHEGDATKVHLDYAFIEWTMSEHAKLRVGRVKQPFGIYAEITKVGVLRPLPSLASSVYGPASGVAEAFNGIGLTGMLMVGQPWSISYDLYGGEIDTVYSHPLIRAGEDIREDVRDFAGGRVVLAPPVDGLSVGASAYSGRQVPTQHRPGTSRQGTVALQGQYERQRWLLRTEVLRHKKDDAQARGGYLEAAYRVTNAVQVAARLDRLRERAAVAASQPQFGRHRDLTVGLNYWLSPEAVLRLSLHDVRGRRFVVGDQPQDTTRLAQVGVHFAF